METHLMMNMMTGGMNPQAQNMLSALGSPYGGGPNMANIQNPSMGNAGSAPVPDYGHLFGSTPPGMNMGGAGGNMAPGGGMLGGSMPPPTAPKAAPLSVGTQMGTGFMPPPTASGASGMMPQMGGAGGNMAPPQMSNTAASPMWGR